MFSKNLKYYRLRNHLSKKEKRTDRQSALNSVGYNPNCFLKQLEK